MCNKRAVKQAGVVAKLMDFILCSFSARAHTHQTDDTPRIPLSARHRPPIKRQIPPAAAARAPPHTENYDEHKQQQLLSLSSSPRVLYPYTHVLSLSRPLSACASPLIYTLLSLLYHCRFIVEVRALPEYHLQAGVALANPVELVGRLAIGDMERVAGADGHEEALRL